MPLRKEKSPPRPAPPPARPRDRATANVEPDETVPKPTPRRSRIESSPAGAGYGLRHARGWLDLRVPRVVGIVNVTPDSFSDGPRYLAPEHAVAHGRALVAAGAEVLDIGGESTRPGAERVPAKVQCERVIPVIRRLAECVDLPLSIDTTRAGVASAALDAGAAIVNDISAGRDDPEMLALVARRGAGLVLMHMRGVPATMQWEVERGETYDDVVSDVLAFLEDRVRAARDLGVEPSRITIDPGIGFGKTVSHNLQLLRELPRFTALGYPVLVGPSRKSFLGAITGRDVGQREMATAGAVAAAVLGGASLLRVHDVALMRDVVLVTSAIREGREQIGR